MGNEVFEWSCKDCGIIIKSLYEGQFKYDREAHKKSHLEKVRFDG